MTRGLASRCAAAALLCCLQVGSQSAGSAPGTTAAAVRQEIISCEDNAVAVAPEGRAVNNTWNRQSAGDGAWRQCLVARNAPDTRARQVGWTWQWPTKAGLYAYPEVLIGQSPWTGVASNDHRFPRRLDNTRRLLLDFDFSVESNGRQNLAAEFWITSGPLPATGVDLSIIKTELMIWTQASPGLVDTSQQPVAEVQIEGLWWTVYARPGWGDASGNVGNKWSLITYHARDNLQQVRLDAAAFLRDAAARGFIDPSDYIAGVEIGNEIVSGSGSTWIKRLQLTVE